MNHDDSLMELYILDPLMTNIEDPYTSKKHSSLQPNIQCINNSGETESANCSTSLVSLYKDYTISSEKFTKG